MNKRGKKTSRPLLPGEEKGLTLLEVLLSLAIIGLICGVAVNAYYNLSRWTGVAGQRSKAAGLAFSAIEYGRAQAGGLECGHYTLEEWYSGWPEYGEYWQDNNMQAQVKVSNYKGEKDLFHIQVVVTWPEKGEEEKIELCSIVDKGREIENAHNAWQ